MSSKPAPLSQSFTAAWRGSDAGTVDLLERALFDLHDQGRRAFPDVALPATELAAYAGERARIDVAACDAVREIDAEGLFLACACACGIPAALRAFESTMLAKIPFYLRKLRASPELEEETRQALLEKLFVASAGDTPRILHYGGRGSLEGWVRITALRTAVNLLEARRPRAETEGDEAIARAISPDDDPELRFLKARYRGPFVAAFREALATLSRRDRALLRFAFVEGLTPERIGKIHGVHRTTAMRWLDAARADVLAATRARLVERFHLTPSECDDIFDLVQSRLDISLRSLLLAEA